MEESFCAAFADSEALISQRGDSGWKSIRTVRSVPGASCRANGIRHCASEAPERCWFTP